MIRNTIKININNLKYFFPVILKFCLPSLKTPGDKIGANRLGC